MTANTKRPPGYGGRMRAVFATIALHVCVMMIAVFVRLGEPTVPDPTVRLWFRGTPAEEEPRPKGVSAEIPGEQSRPNRERIEAAAPQPPQRPPMIDPVIRSNETVQADISTALDTLRDPRRMTLRSVLDRDLSPEEAIEILSKLLEEYPQYKGMVVKEMIAGAGLPPDSLPRINLYLDQILKYGIKPTWGAQRGAIESAWKSFDPVMGWTNKGGYGPQINVIGVLKFLIDLIEGK